ncbi:hypothetical protein J6590_034193 [Homalodisca vitripennis]|nr:hypothetical protein J6590_034193 [Homalodisca vitripennis]
MYGKGSAVAAATGHYGSARRWMYRRELSVAPPLAVFKCKLDTTGYYIEATSGIFTRASSLTLQPVNVLNNQLCPSLLHH